ncbi:leucyl-cystinyl aminopeptidase isoform X2 [Hyperolius riggenbachi]
MIENSMFEEEPDVVDLAKEPGLNPLDSDDVEYEPRSSRLLVRGLGEHELDEEEEDCESSAKLLGMSFMNRSSGRSNPVNYRPVQEGVCPTPSARTVIAGVVVVIILVSISTLIYLLPKCTFTKEGCHAKVHPMELVYPIATNGELFPWARSRLPDFVIPVEYNITVHPNLTTKEFSGITQIKLKILKDTKFLVLHSLGLQNIEANLTLSGGAVHKLNILEYPGFEMIAMALPEKLPNGSECTLKITYCANFSSSYYGFYRISYADGNSSKWLVATQFEPLAARKAFPCFDEPAFKSRFRVKIKRSEEHIALSNMPKMSTTTLPDGLLLDEFDISVKMSTYLVAFIVSDMTNVTVNVNGTLVSVYTMPQKLAQATYALEAAETLLTFFSQYFGIDYMTSKLDLIAIPDIQAAGMENWGLITFRETTLLYKGTSTLMDKQRITAVLAHELAHQWFGNLVTMEWWNDLWLNEGFATYLEYFALQTKFKDLDSDSFLQARCDAMEKDSLHTSHAISTDVQNPEQIEEIFDDLSYIKGASLLLMLKAYLSEEVFHQCIKQYLTDHRYGSAKSEALWKSMNVVTKSKPDVKSMMTTWTRQAGYPLVTVVKAKKEVSVSQERFLRSVNPVNGSENSSVVWQIPLSYTYGPCSEVECKAVFLLGQHQDKFVLKNEVSWLKFNVEMSGYYIVDYGQEGWDALIQQIKNKHTFITASDRANLIHDAFMLSGVGKLQLSKALDLLAYLVNETDASPIKQAVDEIYRISDLLDKLGNRALAVSLKQRAVLDRLSSLVQKQNWTDEGSLTEQELRSLLLELNCSVGNPDCLDIAMQLFNNWRNGTHLPTAVMATVLKVGAQTQDGWVYIFQMYSTSLYEAEKLKMLEALASSSSGNNLLWLMEEGLRGDHVRSQDFATVIRFVSKNVVGSILAWNFVKQKWDEITQKFPPGSYPIQSIVKRTTSQFSTEVYLNEVITFFNSTKGKSKDMWCVKESIETIKLNIQWVDRNLDLIRKWLQPKEGSIASGSP